MQNSHTDDSPDLEQVDYNSLKTAIIANNAKGCVEFFQKNPYSIRFFEMFIEANNIDLLKKVFPAITLPNGIEHHSYSLLAWAFRQSNAPLWNFLLQNGCNTNFPEPVTGRRVIYLLENGTDFSIADSIVATSKPIDPSTNDLDFNFIKSIIESPIAASHGVFILNGLYNRDSAIKISCPLTCLFYLNLALEHGKWGMALWIVKFKDPECELDPGVCSSYLDRAVALIPSQFDGTWTVTTDDLRFNPVFMCIPVLLQLGAEVRDTIDYYRCLCLLLNSCGNRVMYPNLDIISSFLNFKVITLNRPDDWNDSLCPFSPIECVLKSLSFKNYQFFDALFEQGAIITPNLFHYFDERVYPTIALEHALDAGYVLTMNTLCLYQPAPRCPDGSYDHLFYYTAEDKSEDDIEDEYGSDEGLGYRKQDRSNCISVIHDIIENEPNIFTLLQSDKFINNQQLWNNLRQSMFNDDGTENEDIHRKLVSLAYSLKEVHRDDFLDVLQRFNIPVPIFAHDDDDKNNSNNDANGVGDDGDDDDNDDEIISISIVNMALNPSENQ